MKTIKLSTMKTLITILVCAFLVWIIPVQWHIIWRIVLYVGIFFSGWTVIELIYAPVIEEKFKEHE